MWIENAMNIERIYPDEIFWEVNVVKAKALFDRAILPELIGKFYSRTSNTTLQEQKSCSSLGRPEPEGVSDTSSETQVIKYINKKCNTNN